MARPQRAYVCADCGATSVKWAGQCPGCGQWNSLEPQLREAPAGDALARTATVRQLSAVGAEHSTRLPTSVGELDRALGGGIVPGSVILLGGDPGIGKSTLLLQAAAGLGVGRETLYASGEESLEQIGLRGRRLGLRLDGIAALATTRLEEVIAAAAERRPACVVVDSIQTMATDLVPSSPGSPNQLRASAGQLVQLAKQTGIPVILVGHVTKEGQIAGPRLLEHMVDVVLYFESEQNSRYRILRAVKNRFGAANEIGIFVMTDAGIREVKNPSALFLSQRSEPTPGSVATVIHQGSRPLLVEVQGLADPVAVPNPRRVAIGIEHNRLTLLLAALHRHAGIATHGHDVFINVVGGVRVAETAADLAAMLATISSIRDRPLPRNVVVFGEVGLAGEIRPVAHGEERLREAAKVGFQRAVIPRSNLPRQPIAGLEVHGIESLRDLIRVLPALEAATVDARS